MHRARYYTHRRHSTLAYLSAATYEATTITATGTGAQPDHTTNQSAKPGPLQQRL
jgi:hypothetical protein